MLIPGGVLIFCLYIALIRFAYKEDDVVAFQKSFKNCPINAYAFVCVCVCVCVCHWLCGGHNKGDIIIIKVKINIDPIMTFEGIE